MEKQIIDLIELEKTLESTKLSRFLTDKQNITSLTAVIIYELLCVASNFNIPYTIAINLIVPLFVRSLYKNWQKKNDIRGIVVGEIRSSEEFKRCIELYQEYVKRLADLIFKFNFKDSKEIVFYFDLLLNHGFLSSNFKNAYYNYNYDKNYIVELLGARVLSGKSNCRHMSSLAADCLNELGYNSELIIVTKSNCIEGLKTFKDLEKLEWDHGVVAIAENREKYLYDPTCSRLMGKSQIDSPELENNIAEITFTDPVSHVIISPKQYSFSRSHNSLREIVKLPLESLDKNELMAIRKRIVEIFNINQGLAYNFAIENLKSAQEIAYLESIISPHSDSPILEWKIKK